MVIYCPDCNSPECRPCSDEHEDLIESILEDYHLEVLFICDECFSLFNLDDANALND